MPVRLAVELFVFGIGVGCYGTLIGAGGGFLIVPTLLLFFHLSPPMAVGTSLAVVFLNALSGALSYARQERIDYISGVLFAAATIPGAVGGVYLSHLFSSRAFEVTFGLLLGTLGLFLFLHPAASEKPNPLEEYLPLRAPGGSWLGPVVRSLTDRQGHRYLYRYSWVRGVTVSLGVGLLSSLFGIGGGFLHVPVLIFFLGFPTHVATATSQFILAISALTGAALYYSLGQVRLAWVAAMGSGAVIGAVAGAALSERVASARIVRLLSIALVLVGLRLALGG